MAKTRRTRMSAENDHRRVTRLRLRIVIKETQGYQTGYLQASSDTIQHGLESREVGYGFSIILCGHWVNHPVFDRNRWNHFGGPVREDRSVRKSSAARPTSSVSSRTTLWTERERFTVRAVNTSSCLACARSAAHPTASAAHPTAHLTAPHAPHAPHAGLGRACCL